MIKVAHFYRKVSPDFFSIERIFGDVRAHLAEDICIRDVYSTFESRGFFRRVFNLFESLFRCAEVNHITGDIHYLGCILPRKKLIITIHDCVMMRRLSGIRQWIYWFFWLWLPIRRAAIITVVSSEIREEILRYVRVDQKKIRVIPNGLSSEFKYEPKKRSNPGGVILHVGTSDNKNLNRVIVACACRPYKLVILGKLNSRQTSLLEASGIEFEEYSQLAREEVVAQYRNADIVVFPSLYEGFGFPIIEANAVGTPVITSDRHPMKDVSGSAAHLVDPEDANSIGKGIDKVMGDPVYRETLILNGLDNIKRFSIEETSKQYESLYRELCA